LKIEFSWKKLGSFYVGCITPFRGEHGTEDTLNYNEFNENWTKMRFSIQSLTTSLSNQSSNQYLKKMSKGLLAIITTREKKLLDNAGFLSSLSLDPRFKYKLIRYRN
jgi:hypothetical protein